jgi:hypothetical protein
MIFGRKKQEEAALAWEVFVFPDNVSKESYERDGFIITHAERGWGWMVRSQPFTEEQALEDAVRRASQLREGRPA